jgi:branched-chain amino acid transport system substrate-binding protein
VFSLEENRIGGKEMARKPAGRQAAKSILVMTAFVFLTTLMVSEVASAQGKPIMIGIIEPLTGDCAQWGIPIARGGELWAEEQNAQGGILCGDGLRHRIVYKAYENVCYLPAEELKAAKKAILDDKMKFLLQTFTPSCRKAIAPLCEQEKVLNLAWGSGYLSPKYPHTMGGMTASPMCYLALSSYLFEKHPEIKRVAMLSTDDSFGRADRAYLAASCAIQGDRISVVSDTFYDPKATDISSIVTAVLEKEPDVILLGANPPPAVVAIIVEAAYNHGYNGYWAADFWDLSYILQKVPASWMEGKFFAGSSADFSDPYYGPRFTAMYQAYVKKYGKDQWIAFTCQSISILCTLEVGLKKAKTIDPTDVMNTLYSMKEIDHPIYGKSKWGGMEIFGANHHLLTGNPVLMVTNGTQKVVDIMDIGKFWAEHTDVAVEVLKENDQVYREE